MEDRLLTTAYTCRPRSRARTLYYMTHILSYDMSETEVVLSGGATHLLIVRLFFLDPNRPCMKMMGDVCLSAVGFAGSCRSYARGTVEKGEAVCRTPAASKLLYPGAHAETGTRTRRVHPEDACRRADVDDARPIIAV